MNKVEVNPSVVSGQQVALKFLTAGLWYVPAVGAEPLQGMPGGTNFVPLLHIADAAKELDRLEAHAIKLGHAKPWKGFIVVRRTALAAPIVIPVDGQAKVEVKESMGAAVLICR